ncbi:MAG TPA: hypothetical protein PKN48_06765 [Bacteroidales bacterium]|nr:hypothetical protein [Bacteroidales bacterium]
MKDSEKDFDLLIKNSLSDMEIPPPEHLKKGVFGKLSRYALVHKIKRYGIYILLFVLISAVGIFAYQALHEPTATLPENPDLHAGLNKEIPGNDLTKNQNNSIVNHRETKAGIINNGNNTNTDNTNKTTVTGNTKSNYLEKYPEKENKSYTNEIKSNSGNTADKDNINAKDKTHVKSGMVKNISAEAPTDNNDHNKEFTNNIQETTFKTKEQTDLNIIEKSNSPISENKRVVNSIPKMILLKNSVGSDNSLSIISAASPVKKKYNPLIWSAGFNIGQAIHQNPLIQLQKAQDENNYSFNTSLDFPSAIAGLDFRAEKKHFFFDFGVQYSHFSENIKSDDLLINPQSQQFYNFAGQTMNIDTGGGYYHYFWICDSIIRIIDSVWTWKIDSSFTDNYDTINTTVYDTLNNPEWKNSYTFIELPFSVGWQYNFGKINVGLKTGPILSMLIGTKGFIPAYMNDQTTQNAVDTEFRNFRIGLSWQVSAVVSYFISERILIECQPYSRFTITGIKSSSGYTLKNNSLGLMAGIRYYF